MNGQPENHSDGYEPDLLDYWRVLVKRKKIISIASGGAFVLSIIVSLLLPRVYSATASVMPPLQDDPLSAGIAARVSGGLGGFAGGFLGSGSSTVLWIGVLKSYSVRDGIIKRFNLKELYGEDTIEGARKALDSNVAILKSKEEIISVTVDDRDPERAARMANAFIEELDRVNKGAVMTSGSRTRAFLEKRLTEAKAELSRIEGSLKTFQEKNKAVKLDDQSRAIIDAIGTVKGQLMAKEVELETLQSYATPTNPNVQLLKAEVNGLKGKLKELEEGRRANPSGQYLKDIFIPTDKIPALSFQYAKLLRDAKVEETMFELLTQQYEMARIQEAKDSPTVQVLDVAKAPEKKSKPRRVLIVAASTLGTFFISVFLSFFMEYLENARPGKP